MQSFRLPLANTLSDSTLNELENFIKNGYVVVEKHIGHIANKNEPQNVRTKVKTRPSPFAINNRVPNINGSNRGITYWNNNVYTIVNNDVYKNASRIGSLNIDNLANYVDNGTFTTTSNWTLSDAALSISSGTLNCDGTQSGVITATQDVSAVSSKEFYDVSAYAVTFTISNYSAGTMFPVINAAFAGTTRSANGLYNEIIFVEDAEPTHTVAFYFDADFNGKIDDVTVMPVWPGNYNVDPGNSEYFPCYFDILEATTDYLVISDQFDLYTVNTSDTVTKVTDADFPGAHVPGVVVFDGYTCVLDADGTLWNSDVDDPTAWTATSFVTAEIESDKGVALARHLNYLALFGTETLELFYDAANASGSPFSRIEGATANIGCMAGNSVTSIENSLYWVGKSKGKLGVYMLEGLSVKKISDEFIDRVLQNNQGGNASLESTNAIYLFLNGHHFYCINIGITASLVYDIETKMWYYWTVDDDYHGYITQDLSMRIVDVTYDEAKESFRVLPDYGYIRTDTTINFGVGVQKVDLGTNKTKFLNRVELIGTFTGDLTFTLVTDYIANPSVRTFTASANRKVLTRLGRAQRFKFKITGESPGAELEAIEFGFDLGPYGM